MVKRLLKVEIADTPYKHQKGLMFRDKLGENDGMFFKFSHPQDLKFWGVNTYIPLAIAFVSDEDKIEKIGYISPFSDKLVSSDVECKYAIEANYDFFKNNNIKIGSEVELINDKDDFFVKFK